MCIAMFLLCQTVLLMLLVAFSLLHKRANRTRGRCLDMKAASIYVYTITYMFSTDSIGMDLR